LAAGGCTRRISRSGSSGSSRMLSCSILT
jgi:hypothetical protein